MVDWGYYDRFNEITKKFLPDCGEGETMASQIVTAVNKLVYKWYNDGDVYDNTRYLTGWWNDLSSYANWLHEHTNQKPVLEKIWKCATDDDYEGILKELADNLLEAGFLEGKAIEAKTGTIYNCDGVFHFEEEDEEEWEDDWEEDEEEW